MLLLPPSLPDSYPAKANSPLDIHSSSGKYIPPYAVCYYRAFLKARILSAHIFQHWRGQSIQEKLVRIANSQVGLRPIESKYLGVGPRKLGFNESSRKFRCLPKFKNHGNKGLLNEYMIEWWVKVQVCVWVWVYAHTYVCVSVLSTQENAAWQR